MNKLLKMFVVLIILLSVTGCSRKEIVGQIQYVEDDATMPTGSIPTYYSTSTPYPNPFTDSCVVILKLPKSANVKVTIKNSLYLDVKTIFSGHLYTGIYSYRWDGHNDQGEQCIDGFYYFTVLADTFYTSSFIRLKN